MGILKGIFGSKAVVVDPNDLRLPEQISTSKSGLTLTKAKGVQQVDINIVGESHRAANVKAVAAAASGQPFDIYLVAEPTNQYDKKAVAVYAANVHVGYIGAPANKQWFKWVNEALERKELLWGEGRAITRKGTDNTGIFGFIFMPRASEAFGNVVPQKLTDSAIAKAIEKVTALANKNDEPETLAQLKSFTKKCLSVASPIAAHAKWVDVNPNEHSENVRDQWMEVLSACESIYENAENASYATDAYEIDASGSLEELVEALEALKSGGPTDVTDQSSRG